jgi:hypothetical protein
MQTLSCPPEHPEKLRPGGVESGVLKLETPAHPESARAPTKKHTTSTRPNISGRVRLMKALLLTILPLGAIPPGGTF